MTTEKKPQGSPPEANPVQVPEEPVTPLPVAPPANDNALRSYVGDYLNSMGWTPVPLPFGTKAPIGNDWEKRTLAGARETFDVDFPGTPGNVGIVLGAPSGDLVDIDLDCPEAIDIADMFLPPTMTFGRATARNAHRLYRTKVKTQKYIDPLRKKGEGKAMIVEVRSTGGQTMFPPSVHPNGERLEFSDVRDPLPADPTPAAARIASVVLLSRVWPGSGGRHEAYLALAGWLAPSMPQADVVLIVRALCQLTGDGDPENRLGAVQSTYDCIAKDAPVKGWRALGEAVGNDIALKKVKGWLRVSTEAPVDNAARIRQAFRTDRDYPYTPEETAGICVRLGCTPDELQRLMVVRAGDAVWLMFNGDYSRRLGMSELVDAARTLLAPAGKVELTYINDKNKRVDKKADRLMREYGTHATGGVMYDLTAQSSRYDAAEGCFRAAPCPIRALEPTFDPEIDTWLRLLGGEKADRLLDWLACASDLTRAAPALVLLGETDAGKSLLAAGVARLFHKGDPTSLDVRMSDFNGVSVLRCPITFGDERMTTDFRGHDRFNELKAHISADSFEGQDKNMPKFVAIGALRYFLAAQDAGKLFSLRGDLSKEDIDALEARFLVIQASLEPVEYIRSLGGVARTTGWTKGDGIAKHILWLRDNRTVAPGLRFAVPGHCPELVATLATESGFRQHLLPWIFAAMKDSTRFSDYDTTLRRAVQVWEGEVWVNAQGIVDSWCLGGRPRYPGGVSRPPGLAQIRGALVQICVPSDGRQFRPHGRSGIQIRFRQVQPELLRRWAQQNDEDFEWSVTVVTPGDTPGVTNNP